jgi:hypothetical protein
MPPPQHHQLILKHITWVQSESSFKPQRQVRYPGKYWNFTRTHAFDNKRRAPSAICNVSFFGTSLLLCWGHLPYVLRVVSQCSRGGSKLQINELSECARNIHFPSPVTGPLCASQRPKSHSSLLHTTPRELTIYCREVHPGSSRYSQTNILNILSSGTQIKTHFHCWKSNLAHRLINRSVYWGANSLSQDQDDASFGFVIYWHAESASVAVTLLYMWEVLVCLRIIVTSLRDFRQYLLTNTRIVPWSRPQLSLLYCYITNSSPWL